MFCYKDISEELPAIFGVIQCNYWGENCCNALWNLWPYKKLHWITSSDIMVFLGLCFSLSINYSHGTSSGLSWNMGSLLLSMYTTLKLSYAPWPTGSIWFSNRGRFPYPKEKHPVKHKASRPSPNPTVRRKQRILSNARLEACTALLLHSKWRALPISLLTHSWVTDLGPDFLTHKLSKAETVFH